MLMRNLLDPIIFGSPKIRKKKPKLVAVVGMDEKDMRICLLFNFVTRTQMEVTFRTVSHVSTDDLTDRVSLLVLGGSVNRKIDRQNAMRILSHG